MDALTAQPSRTFKQVVNNPANPESGVIVPVTITIRGDLQKAESLLYMAPGVLQKMRYENAQHLPDYRKTVTVGGEGGRWEATIISQTQFGVESVNIYVPPIPSGLPPKEEESTTVMYVPTFEIRDADDVVTGYVMSYHHWGGAYEYIAASDLLTTLHNFYDESWWYENDGVDPFQPGDPHEVLLYLQRTGDSDNWKQREIYNIPCRAEKLLTSQRVDTGTKGSEWDGSSYVYTCPGRGFVMLFGGSHVDTTTWTYNLHYHDDYTSYYNGDIGPIQLSRDTYPRNYGSGSYGDGSVNLIHYTPTIPPPIDYDDYWVDAFTWYEVSGTAISHQDSAASYEADTRGCLLWADTSSYYYRSCTSYPECADDFPNINRHDFAGGDYLFSFNEYFSVNGQNHLTLTVVDDYYYYNPEYCSVRWYQLGDDVGGSVIALGALRRRSGGSTNSRYEYFFCSDTGGNQRFSYTWFPEIVNFEHLIPNVTDYDNNPVYAAGEFRLFKIVTTTKTTIPAPL